MLNVSFKNIIRNMPDIRALKLPNVRELGNCTYSGPPVFSEGYGNAPLLRNLGIHSIIDFREDAPKSYELFCRKNGFDYFKFPLDSVENVKNTDYYINTSVNSYKVSPKLMIMLQKFLQLMKRGHVYAGCQYGIDRTNKGLAINYFLGNAKPPRLLHWEDETQKTVVNRNVRIVNKIFRHLTPEQKQILGLPESFKDILSNKMGNFIFENKG